MGTTYLRGFGIPRKTLDDIYVAWKECRPMHKDYGDHGWRIYTFVTKNGSVCWGLNLWKINTTGIYKSNDVASVRSVEPNSDGLIVRMYGRPPLQIFRSD